MVPLYLNPQQGIDYFTDKGSLPSFFISHLQLQYGQKIEGSLLHLSPIYRIEVDHSRGKPRILGLMLPLLQLTHIAEAP